MPAHTSNKMILRIQYLWMILHNSFIIRNCSSRGPVVENDVEKRKVDTKLQKVVFLCFSECCHGNMCNLNVIVVLEFISRSLYLLFAIPLRSKLQNSIFYRQMRPKSDLKFPRPFILLIVSRRYFCCGSNCIVFLSRIDVLFEPYIRFHILV